MKKILIAGGGGYIGSVLCEELLEQGHQVLCLDRFFFGKDIVTKYLTYPHFKMLQDDIRFVDEKHFEGVDIVFDLAGISNDPSCDLDPELTKDINYNGNLRIATLAKKKGVKRYIYSSSCSIYGAGDGTPLTEESPMNPVSLYARTKADTERDILKLADDQFCVTTLRNATVYGLSPRMRFDLIVNLMTAHAVSNRKIFVLGGGKQWRPNIHVRDVCKAFMMVMNAAASQVNKEIFNVGVNEQNYQVFQVANMIREVVPFVDVELVPDDIDKRNYNVNFDKIKKVLDFKVDHNISEGALEVKQALETTQTDFDDIRTVTLKYYKYLLDADRILNEVKLNGKVF